MVFIMDEDVLDGLERLFGLEMLVIVYGLVDWVIVV